MLYPFFEIFYKRKSVKYVSAIDKQRHDQCIPQTCSRRQQGDQHKLHASRIHKQADKKAHQKPYPASFSISPKANPRKRYPSMTGMDCTIA